ncbi:MAG: hypothetical protein F4130_03060 [Acidobacteria bacterium]|nr:hypothetical protein [Acidobacteriota bacterium]
MSHRPVRRTRVLAAGAVYTAALGVLHAGCGGDGGAPAAPPAPPPPQPLGWSDLPGEITVEVAETATFTATLTAAVDATYTISANSEAVEVSGEALRAGVFQGSVTGVEAGEAEITVTASHTGYVTAMDSLDVIVEDPFDQALWRELVFDAFDCPNGFTDESCRNFWGERNVEDRITAVLPFQPNFHVVSSFREWRFTSSDTRTIGDAIRDSVEQITGETFTGQITSGRGIRDEYGWVDVVPVGSEILGGRTTCGGANVGQTEGLMVVNVEGSDSCDLFAVTMHEVGHVLGFFHVLNLGDFIMSPILTEIPAVFSETEQFHAQLAWELGRGVPYTPDPRKASSSSLLTTDSAPGTRTLEELPLDELVHCPLH